MNKNNEIRPSEMDDDRRFDLLVDDELGEVERRELLSRLDDEPGGWRRCALAFLEAQSWKKELGTFLRESDARPQAAISSPRPARHTRHTMTWLAMAASFLAAAVLGGWLLDRWYGGDVTTRVPLDTIADTGAGQPAPLKVPERAVPDRARTASPWQMVTLSSPEGSPAVAKPFRLPATEQDRLDGKWLSGLPRAVPDDVLKSLERTGHRVRQHRGLMPVDMEDGRRMVVPVDQLDVHYVGNPTL